MLKGLKDRFSKNSKPDVAVKKRTFQGSAERLEQYAEAAAYAEAGLQDLAQDLVRSGLHEKPKVLVVGNEESFSKPLVEYAVGFAKRMDYAIVAMNCVPFGHEAPKVLSPYQEQLCREFESRAAQGAEVLACRAAEQGVDFQHVVMFGSPDRCIRELHHRTRRVEFVVTEPETSGQNGLESAIPVFSLAD
jgi:hypothetical protein